MEKSFIIAGFGGQGVMVAGQLLSYTACETTDKYVTYFPSYGADSYTLSGGENIQWLYTCNMGADVGNTYMG